MTIARITLAALAAAAALVAAGCGGGSGSVPEGAIAVVAGEEIPKSDLDEVLGLVEKGMEASGQAFPKAGTPEYQSLQTQYVALLVQRAEFKQAAEELGIVVTPKDITEAEQQFIKDRFGGKRAEYLKALKEQGFTTDDLRSTLEDSALSQKIFDEVTKEAAVTDEDILEYYTQNQSQYGTPESRDVRHILIAEKTADGKVDYEKSKAEADRIYQELEDGGNFAALAKANSDDPGSKDSGGKLTISRGQTVPEFDKVSFELDKGELSEPVKTDYGYHVIVALSDVRAPKTTPLADLRDSIKASLEQQKRNEIMNEWVEDLTNEYKSKVSYAEGFEPPELPEVPTTATE